MNLRLPAITAVIVAAAGAAAYRAFHQEPAPPIASIATGSTLAGEPSGNAGGTPPGTAMPAAPQPHRTDARVTVYVAGAVVRAGVYALPSGSRGVDALHVAGGARGDADLVAVNLAQPLEDGEEIVVPVVGADPPAGSAASSVRRSRRARADGETGPVRKAHRKRARKHRKRRSATVDASSADTSGSSDASDANAASTASAADDAPTETVDLNTADENELETLPGIGASLAARIVEFREVNGPFASADDLLDVGGMTQGRLDAIEPYVTTR